MEVCFFRHPSKTPNYITIYVQISMAGQKLEIGSTGIKIPLSDWDEKKKEVAGSNSTCMAYNATLQKIKSRLINVFNELSDQDVPFSVYNVKNGYNQKFNQNAIQSPSLLQRYESYRKEKNDLGEKADQEKKKRPKGCSVETVKSIGPLIKKLKEYLIFKRQVHIRPLEFDVDYYQDYIAYMRETGYMESTIRAHCNKLKQLYGWMKRKKFINVDELAGIALPKDPGTIPAPLTSEGFQRLCTVQFKNSNVQKAADLLVIHCRTGLHYGDLQHIIKRAINHEKVTFFDTNGIEWLFNERSKTEVQAKIPILPEVRAIVTKYGGWHKLPRFDNGTFNAWLKFVAAEADLHDVLTVSNGRDTMVDWLLNEQLISRETVLVILGRKDDRDLDRYGRADERRIIKELKL